ITMAPYLLECIVLDYYERVSSKASAFVDLELPGVLAHVASAVLSTVTDPKRIQSDINTLTWEDRLSISSRAGEDAKRSAEARRLEDAGQHRESIDVWRRVLGDGFPEYG